MTRILSLVLVLLLIFAAPAGATVRTLVVSGPWGKAADWQPEGAPRLGDPVVIPAGKEAVIKAPVKAGGVTVEGELSGCCTLETNGSVTFTHPLGWHGTINSVGVDQLRLGGTVVETVNDPGILSLQEPVVFTAGMAWHGSLNTNGYPMRVRGLAYPLEGSYSDYGASEVVTDEWLDYPHEPSEDVWVEQFSEHATVVVNRARTMFKGAGWYYGTVDLAGGEQTFAGDSFRVDVLRLDSPVITVEDGQTITTDVLTSDASAGAPVRVQAGSVLGGPGGAATIDCGGCAVPPYVELVGVKVQ